MNARCHNPNNPDFLRWYGSRGITVCNEWRNSFEAFYDWAIQKGYSDNLSIDRINNDGNYEPSNCRWVSNAEQAKNRRGSARMIKCKEPCPVGKIGVPCCHNCTHGPNCKETCELAPSTCGCSEKVKDAMQIFNTSAMAVINNIATLLRQKAEIDKSEKFMRAQLEAAMMEHAVEKIDHPTLKINYIKPTTRTSIDSAKLKTAYPHIHAECSKTSNVSGYVKIELKGDKAK